MSVEREELLRQSINESEKKAGWSHVTALHCIVLPEHVPAGYCSPLLPHLAIKWQDRFVTSPKYLNCEETDLCLSYTSSMMPHPAKKNGILTPSPRCMEVREAAQALFLRELRRIGFAGRQQLVGRWYPYIVRKREASPPEPVEKLQPLDLPVIPDYFLQLLNSPE